jgi:uncharacterized NAD-dependent epimerase/dehydratase family protein
MSAAERQHTCAAMAERTGLPVTDPIAMGVQPIADRLLQRCR